jgi:hypothetical protein
MEQTLNAISKRAAQIMEVYEALDEGKSFLNEETQRQESVAHLRHKKELLLTQIHLKF